MNWNFECFLNFSHAFSLLNFKMIFLLIPLANTNLLVFTLDLQVNMINFVSFYSSDAF